VFAERLQLVPALHLVVRARDGANWNAHLWTRRSHLDAEHDQLRDGNQGSLGARERQFDGFTLEARDRRLDDRAVSELQRRTERRRVGLLVWLAHGLIALLGTYLDGSGRRTSVVSTVFDRGVSEVAYRQVGGTQLVGSLGGPRAFLRRRLANAGLLNRGTPCCILLRSLILCTGSRGSAQVDPCVSRYIRASPPAPPRTTGAARFPSTRRVLSGTTVFDILATASMPPVGTFDVVIA
jgi:hypothetical protein